MKMRRRLPWLLSLSLSLSNSWLAYAQIAPGSSTFTNTAQNVHVGKGVHVLSGSDLKNAASLDVQAGGTALIDLSKSAAVKLSGNLSNSGHIFAFSSNPLSTTASIYAQNVFNNSGAVISTVLPASIMSILPSTTLSHLDLNIIASQSIINAGSISSSANLSLFAATSINNQGSLSAQQNLNLAAGQFINAGLASALSGNINVSGVSQHLLVNNASGVISAIQGHINISELVSNSALSIGGGDWLSRSLNVSNPGGSIEMHVNQISGIANLSASTIHFSAATNNLLIGSVNASGDPSFYNTAGTVTISGPLVFSGQDLAIIAQKDILSGPGSGPIDSSSSTGKGGAITMVAGASFTSTGLPANSNDTSSTLSINGASTSGGQINLAGANPISSLDSSSSASNGNGGKITLVAFYGSAAGSGQISLPSAVTVHSSGNGTGSNGDLTMIAGAPGPALNSIAIGAVNASGGASGTGNVTLSAATPVIQNAPVTILNGSVSSGSFSTGALQSASVQSGNISAGGDLTINSNTVIVGPTNSLISAGNILINTSILLDNGSIQTSNSTASINIQNASGTVYLSGTGQILGPSGAGQINVSSADVLTIDGALNFSACNCAQLNFSGTNGINIAPGAVVTVVGGVPVSFGSPVISFQGDGSIIAAGSSALTFQSGAQDSQLSIVLPSGGTARINTSSNLNFAPTPGYGLTFSGSGAALANLLVNSPALILDVYSAPLVVASNASVYNSGTVLAKLDARGGIIGVDFQPYVGIFDPTQPNNASAPSSSTGVSLYNSGLPNSGLNYWGNWTAVSDVQKLLTKVANFGYIQTYSQGTNTLSNYNANVSQNINNPLPITGTVALQVSSTAGFYVGETVKVANANKNENTTITAISVANSTITVSLTNTYNTAPAVSALTPTPFNAPFYPPTVPLNGWIPGQVYYGAFSGASAGTYYIFPTANGGPLPGQVNGGYPGTNSQAYIPTSNYWNAQVANSLGMRMSAGVMVAPVQANNDSLGLRLDVSTGEFMQALSVAKQYPGTIKDIVVGNEWLMQTNTGGTITSTTLQQMNHFFTWAKSARDAAGFQGTDPTQQNFLPVTTKLQAGVLAGVNNTIPAYSAVQQGLKTLLTQNVEHHVYGNMYAYFDGNMLLSNTACPSGNCGTGGTPVTQGQFQSLVKGSMTLQLSNWTSAFSAQGVKLQLRLGETGWPSNGLRTNSISGVGNSGTVASWGNPTFAQWYYGAMKTWTARPGSGLSPIPTYYFEAFDEPNKGFPNGFISTTPASSEAFYGLFTAAGTFVPAGPAQSGQGAYNSPGFILGSLNPKWQPSPPVQQSLQTVRIDGRLIAGAGLSLSASSLQLNGLLGANTGNLSLQNNNVANAPLLVSMGPSGQMFASGPAANILFNQTTAGAITVSGAGNTALGSLSASNSILLNGGTAPVFVYVQSISGTVTGSGAPFLVATAPLPSALTSTQQETGLSLPAFPFFAAISSVLIGSSRDPGTIVPTDINPEIKSNKRSGETVEPFSFVPPALIKNFAAEMPLDPQASSLTLNSESAIFAPSHKLSLSISFGSLNLQAGSIVLILQSDKATAIFNLHDVHNGAVSFDLNGQKITVPAGHQLVLTYEHASTFDQLNPAKISYRDLIESALGTLRVFVAEFSLPSAFISMAQLRQIFKSRNSSEQAMAQRLLKTAAALSIMGGRRRPFKAAP